MNNKDAIVLLKLLKGNKTDVVTDALDMAIESLQRGEVVTCENCKHGDKHRIDTIIDCGAFGRPFACGHFCSYAKRRIDE